MSGGRREDKETDTDLLKHGVCHRGRLTSGRIQEKEILFLSISMENESKGLFFGNTAYHHFKEEGEKGRGIDYQYFCGKRETQFYH